MERTIEQAQAFVIRNTLKKNKNRPNNIVEIAESIDFLSEKLGGLNEVSKTIGISSEMLSYFQMVNNLTVEVKSLVKSRKIDSVTIVKYLSKFNENEQVYLANEVLHGNLNSVELRYIYPLRRKLKQLTIQEVVNKHLQSRNIKISKAVFELSNRRITENVLRESFIKIVGIENFISLTIEETIGTLKISKKGETILREIAKTENLTIKQFFTKLLNDYEYAGY